MKTLFKKKLINIGDNSYLAKFKNIKTMRSYYNKCEAVCDYVNFRGEINNWACFCKNENMAFKPDPNNLSVLIKIL